MTDTYERITYLERAGVPTVILAKDYIDVEFEANDRESFVYSRVRRVKRKGIDYVKP